MKKLLLIISFICIKQLNAQVCFTPHADYDTDTNPTGIFSTDFNNDGKADLVTCNAANDITVFLGDGTGTYTTSTTYTTPLFNPTTVTGGNFNGDAFIDLLITVPTNQLIVALNDGAGGFTTTNTFTVSNAPFGTTIADFNGDNFADIATANYGSGNASIILGDGAGNFTPGNNYNTAAGAQAITSGDFNSDGKMDIAVCNYSGNNVSVLFGNGNGTMNAKTNTSVGLAPIAIVAGDFNGDGKPDLVTANANSASITLLLNNGVGTYSTATSYTGIPNPTGIVTGDFNSDGKLDVAVAVDNGASISAAAILLGDGAGAFGAPINFSTDADPRSICTGDFNADGKPDIATGNRGSNDMSVLLNHALPLVKASATDTSVCSGESISLNGIGATTYTWTGGGPPPVDSQTFTPLGTITYTVTGTINSCSAWDTLTIEVNSLPTIGSNITSTAVCTGNLITLTASGASTYTWSNSVSDGVGFTPISNTYTVTGTDANGCVGTKTVSVTVNSLPTITANSPTICLGNFATLTAQGGSTYTWSPATDLSSNTGTSVTVDPVAVANNTYTITGKDVHGCVSTTTISVDVNPTPTVTAHATKTSICSGSSVTLTGSGALSYTWTGGATDGTAFAPTTSQTYTVTGSDANNCIGKDNITVNVSTLSAPEICMVTTDSFFVNNVVYWDRTAYTNADSFIVYRLNAGTYLKVGAVSKDSSQLTDTKRNIGGPNGGDPNVTAWTYKLAIKDTCGNVSAMSPYHQTINIQQNNQNLSWNAYVIESPQADPVNDYQVLRDSLGIGDWHVFVNTSGMSTNDPNYNLYPNANYRVDALGFSCNPTLRLANNGNNNVLVAKVKSHSNQNNNRQSGIKQLAVNNKVSVYPNPSNGNFSLSINNFENASVEVYNALGEMVYTKNLTTNTENINIEKYNAGVYFIHVKQNGAYIFGNNIILTK